MNTYMSKVLVFLLSLFLIITVVSQIYFAMQDTYDTETAIAYTATDEITFYGVFIRDETPVIYDGGGVISYPNADGSKIAKGSNVAVVYGSEADIDLNSRIEELEEEIALLEASQDPGATEVAEPEVISQLITERYKLLASEIADADMSGIHEQKNELLTLMNIMQIVTDREENYDSRISELKLRLDELKESGNAPIATVSVPDGGYFISYVDGYENLLNKDMIADITVETIEEVINGEGAETITNGIGKVYEDYSWKLVGVIDATDRGYIQGSSVQLRFTSTPETIPAYVEEIRATDDPQKSIIVLNCNVMNSALVQRRTDRVVMKIADYEGIRVPRSAIRFVNGEKGVYTKLGEEVIFKKLDVLYETDDYVISRKTTDSSYVVLYDDVIIEGVDQNDRL